ncbi:MAG TPA: tetratricopeptide repeat protein [Pyrinomonadaceae bacterium]|jgi:tetratricopeptide (TPR) repeat protein|nr:tetratricopeptide repeat protein [Pyrinomonadaceae bacterium]
MQDLVIKSGRDIGSRIVIIAVVVATLLIAYFGIKWQLGDMLATLTDPANPQAAEVADLALKVAPSDPKAASLRARIGPDESSDETRSAVEMAEETVRLSPNDYRWRIELARNLANDGQVERAESEFKRSIDFAPNYAVCSWYYGNFLLRQNRSEEAIAQFKLAASNDPTYRIEALSLLWDVSGKDVALIESVAGDAPENMAYLSLFFASRGRGNDALRNWDRLSDEQKLRWRTTERVMAEGLFQQKRFPEALDFSRQLGDDPDALFQTVTNGSFENSIELSPREQFGWQIARGDARLDIAADGKVAFDGRRSLRLTFKSYARPSLSNVVETIATEPESRYRLTFLVRTENLKTSAGPMIDVANACDTISIARSSQFPNGTTDWQHLSIDFTTESCSGILIRTIRESCGGDACPISGIVWYDGFVLSRL